MKIEIFQYDYNRLSEENRETFTKIIFGNTPTQTEVNEIYFKISEINFIKTEIISMEDHDEVCEFLFMFFNRDDRPNGKYFRSMSVGDIVCIDNEKYICASFGFDKFDIDLSSVPTHENSQTFNDIF